MTVSTRGHDWLCFLGERIGTVDTGLCWVSVTLCIMEEGAFPSVFEKMPWRHVFTFANFLVDSCVIGETSVVWY